MSGQVASTAICELSIVGRYKYRQVRYSIKGTAMDFREKHNILHKDRLEAQTRPDRQSERVSRY